MIRRAQRGLSVVFFLAAHAASAQGGPLPARDTCQYNCAQVGRVGGSLVLTLLDKAGAPTRVLTHALDADAKQLAHLASKDKPDDPRALNTSAVHTTTTTYGTGAEIIIVTTTYVHDARGKLIDARFSEARYPRAQFER